MRNDSRYNVTTTPGSGTSIGSQVSTGNYRISVRIPSTGVFQLIHTVPAASWPGGGIISFVANECFLTDPVPPLNWLVEYVQVAGSHEVNPFDGISSMQRRAYLTVAEVSVNAGADQTVCNIGQPTQLSASGAGSYVWSPTTYLSSPSNISNPTFTPPAFGTYSLTVTGTTTFPANQVHPNPITCSDNDQVIINVVNGPKVYLGRDVEVCSINDFPYFINGTTSGGTNYTWEFTNLQGTTSVLASGPSITGWNATQPGKYCLTVTDANGCSTTDCMEIRISNLNAGIVASSTVLCGNNPNPITLQATPQQSGNAYVYSWNTGASTETIQVTSPGTYSVTVGNIYGCIDVATIEITDIDFDFDDVSYCYDDCVFDFTANVSAPPGTQISYLWDFGHGVTSTLANPSIQFQYYGVNQVTLTITATTGNQSCNFTHTFSVFNNCPDEKCKAGADFFTTLMQPALFYGPRRYLFTDNSTSGGSGQIISYDWSINRNGVPFASYNTQNIDVTWSSGTYEICLKIVVMNPNGILCTDTKCIKITIPARPRNALKVQEGEVKVYPNPSSGLINLNMEMEEELSVEKNVSIYNNMGVLVFQKEGVIGKDLEIDLSGQPAGIYNLIVDFGESHAAEKIVIQ